MARRGCGYWVHRVASEVIVVGAGLAGLSAAEAVLADLDRGAHP